MYRKFFGLNRHPFSKEIAHEDLFAAQGNKELETRLTHLIVSAAWTGVWLRELGSGTIAAWI